MIISGAKNINEAVEGLQRLRSYKPFQYSGTWYIARLGEECHAHRSVGVIAKKAKKLGIEKVELVKLSPS